MEETRRSGVPGEEMCPQRPGQCGPGGRSGRADSLVGGPTMGMAMADVLIGGVAAGCGYWGCGCGCRFGVAMGMWLLRVWLH